MISGFNGAIVYLFPREKYHDAYDAFMQYLFRFHEELFTLLCKLFSLSCKLFTLLCKRLIFEPVPWFKPSLFFKSFNKSTGTFITNRPTYLERGRRYIKKGGHYLLGYFILNQWMPFYEQQMIYHRVTKNFPYGKLNRRNYSFWRLNQMTEY